MFIPKAIEDAFDAMRGNDDPLTSLRTIKVLRDWLSDMEIHCIETAHTAGHTFQEIAEVQERPRQAVHRTLKSARTPGLTDPLFEGVSSSTLRFWLEWWSAPERSSAGVEEAGRDPAVEAARVRTELNARADAGILRRPVPASA